VPKKRKELLPTLKQLQRHKNNPKLCYIIEVIVANGTLIGLLRSDNAFCSYNCYYVK